MEKIAEGIIRRRRPVMAVFLILAVLCAVLLLGVDVNYDLTDYLPSDTNSTQALGIMEREFDTGVPNTRVMVPDLTLAQALEMKEQIAKAEGVTAVQWLDDVEDLHTPVELMDEAVVSQYWKDGTALYSVTIADGMEMQATDAIYELIGEEGAITGNAASTAASQKSVVREVLGAAAILVPLIIVLLLLTTTSWIAPLLFLVTIGVAVLINMGTNIFLGEISFVTQSVSPILQLAVSLDYAIFLLGSFERHRSETPDAARAMCLAIRESFSSIAASAVTTVFGFLALMFMRFGIGSDLGLNLVKGVVISYISVMVFLPGLALSCVKLLDKTRHRRLIPEFRKIGRGLVRIRIPALILLLLIVVPCFLGQSRAEFLYGYGEPSPELRYGADTERVNETFGESTAVVLLVPRGEPGRERELCRELEALPHVTSVIAYANTVGEIPDGFLAEDVTANFYSDDYARIILYTDTGEEGDVAFATVEAIQSAAARYYDQVWTCGQSVNLYDMRDVITQDSGKVNAIAIVFILLTLLVTFRSVTLPLILLFVIESAIWINLSVPYFTDTPLVYLGYLVINTVQLGATIDYAILLTDGYMSNRRRMGRREAVISTLNTNFLSVLTSGLILAAAGFCLSLESSMAVVAELGQLLARGTLLSMALVLLVLPALLMLFDPLTGRLTWKAGFLKKSAREETQK